MTSPQGSGTPPRPPVAGDATGIGSGWAPRPSAGPDTAGAASAVPSAALPTPAGAATGAAAAPGPRAQAQRERPSGPDEPGLEERRGGSGAPQEARDPDGSPTTVLPGSSGTSSVRRPGAPRPAARPTPARSAPARTPRPADGGNGRGSAKSRRARLALQRIDPWSVFLYTLLSSVFLGVALIVAAFVLYVVLGALGVPETVNDLYVELTDASSPLLTSGRVLAATAVLAAVNVVLLTLLATLAALLYNLCASFTGGIEVTLGERDS